MSNYVMMPLADNVEEMFIGPFGSSLKNDCFVDKDNGFCMVYEQKHAIQKTMNVKTRYVDKKKYNELKRFNIRGGDIIVSCRGTIGETFIVPDNAPLGIMHPSIMKIRIKEEVYDKFYFNLLLRERLKKHEAEANGSGIKMAISARELGAEFFPVPPMNEQRRISSLVLEVTKVIEVLQQQFKKLDELVKARFVEMFGNPATNPKGWTTKPLLDMGYCKNGMNFHTGDSGMEMHCLGVGDFKDMSVIDGTEHLPVISLNEAPPEESMLRDGDIVFVRSNGNKALVGRCLVVYPHNTPTTYSGFCIRYRLTSNEVVVDYLLRVLKADSMRKKMAGRGVNIQNLNQQILASLYIPLPPIKLQEQFAAFVEQVNKSKAAVQKALDEAQLLLDSLMQQYFL